MTVLSPTIKPMRIDGTKLRRVREERFMSRAEVARKANLHPDHIGRLERGDAPGGSRLDNIRKIAEALGVEPSEIVVAED
jgi:transcriptional regulator with XRE-family HTH domain